VDRSEDRRIDEGDLAVREVRNIMNREIVLGEVEP
jgi:hypothetical protein